MTNKKHNTGTVRVKILNEVLDKLDVHRSPNQSLSEQLNIILLKHLAAKDTKNEVEE